MTNLEIYNVKTILCVTVDHTRVLVETRFVYVPAHECITIWCVLDTIVLTLADLLHQMDVVGQYSILNHNA